MSMIKRDVSIRYVATCDECGKELGYWVQESDYVPSKQAFLILFGMHHTEDGKDVCQACFTKNFGKIAEIHSHSTIDKC